MYFLMTTMVFWVLGLGSFVTSRFLGEEASFVTAIIALVLFLIGLLVQAIGVFNNMDIRERQKQGIQQIECYRKKIEISQRAMESYKREVATSLTQLYPDYEKELFKSMTPNDAENLSMYLAKYPELKFNGVLQSYTDALSKFLRDIRNLEDSIEEEKLRLRNLQSSGWSYVKVPFSEIA